MWAAISMMAISSVFARTFWGCVSAIPYSLHMQEEGQKRSFLAIQLLLLENIAANRFYP
jgi:hypothetical protein